MTGWQVFFGADHKRHVEPKDDIRQHRHSLKCWCNPTLDEENGGVIVHNSMDRRELYEGKAPG